MNKPNSSSHKLNVSSYRPKVGETLFVGLSGNEPILITVNRYFDDPRCNSEQFEYTKADGKVSSSGIEYADLYPNAPIDSKWLYVVTLDQNDYIGSSDQIELEYFFDPQSAFEHIEKIESGEVTYSLECLKEFYEYYVRVEKIK